MFHKTSSFYCEEVKKKSTTITGENKKRGCGGGNSSYGSNCTLLQFSGLFWCEAFAEPFFPTNFLSGLAANDSPAFTDEYSQRASLQLLFSILCFNHTKQPPPQTHEYSNSQSTRQKEGQVAFPYVCRYCHNRMTEIRYSNQSIFMGDSHSLKQSNSPGESYETTSSLPKMTGT